MFNKRPSLGRVSKRSAIVLGVAAVMAVGGLHVTSASAMPDTCKGKPKTHVYKVKEKDGSISGREQSCSIWYDGGGKVKPYANPNDGIKTGTPAKAQPQTSAPIKKKAAAATTPVVPKAAKKTAVPVQNPTIRSVEGNAANNKAPVRVPIAPASEGATCNQGMPPQGDLYCALTGRWTANTWLQKVTGNDEVAKYWQKRGLPDPRVTAAPNSKL